MKAAILGVLSLFLAGCVSTPPPLRGEVRRLIAHPGFEDARTIAPSWTTDALETVARLEYELNRRSP